MQVWLKRMSAVWMRTRTIRTNRFECLMSWADQVAKRRHEEGLRDLIKIILRPIQAAHMTDAYLKPADKATEELWWLNSLGLPVWLPSLQERLDSYIINRCTISCDDTCGKKLNLASDIVLPTVWNASSIVRMLGAIGKGLPCGEFQQSINHRVSYMSPIGIGWVDSGNHSIAQAIIRGEGWLTPTEIINVDSIIDLVRYDGNRWRCMETGTDLGEPRYEAFGWAWEIGRRLKDLK